ncbi:transposase [Streptomyces sp. NPDC005055]
MRQLGFHGTELDELDRRVAVETLDDPDIRQLLTIPGVDVKVTLSVTAAVGDLARFRSADKLVAGCRTVS